MRRELIGCLLTGLGSLCLAQGYSPLGYQGSVAEPVKIEELETPLPTGLPMQGQIAVAVRGTELKFGVLPDSIAPGRDGVTRYLIVATSASGVINAMQEGIRCASGEVKVYARYTQSGNWVAVKSPTWQPLSAQRHSQALATAGLCDPPGISGRSPRDVLRDLIASSQQPLR